MFALNAMETIKGVDAAAKFDAWRFRWTRIPDINVLEIGFF
jgi:hypothetical protein